MSCKKRIDRAFLNGTALPLSRRSRYAVFSDCHRGAGNMSDNFLKNQPLYLAALEYYDLKKFYYLELGDGDELWENRSRKQISECHADVFAILERFQRENRYCRIYGNHDMELRREFCESILLKNQEGGRDVYMIHGHQGDFFNSSCWRLSRFLVRYLWKPLELFGVNDPTSAARNYKKVETYERCMARAAKEKDVYLFAGHSHRPRLMEGELYVNTGSCVHPYGITAVEIENMQMSLVKWQIGAKEDGTLAARREALAGGIAI